MDRRGITIWIVGLLVLAWMEGFSANLSASGINYEVVALMAIKNDLNDPYNVLENWDINSVDPCSWRMVTCSVDGYVSALGLPSQSLSGTLSPGIGNLSNLQSVLLQNNAITGPIPAGIGKLEKLQTLDLSNNKLNGEIPSSLGDLKNLNYLDLSYNNISGSLPKISARTFKIIGNPLICGPNHENCSIAQEPLSSPPDALRDQYDLKVRLGHLKRYPFKELRTATDHFNPKNILGRGGYGIVYKGCLQDGTLVAVKRLQDYNAVGREVQFETEVKTISLALHRNLLRLYGFCMTENEQLLVYPYMPNGSVASRLRVVGDFGLAKLLDHRDSHVTTAVRGTVGHIAPEYLSTGQSSEKTDVFGFGILLLELITGQKALDFGRAANQKGVMLDWVKKLHQEGKLNLMVDKDLKNNFNRVELEEMIQVALLCTQFHSSHRPKMSEVVRMLEGDGLAEKWEASQKVETPRFRSSENPTPRYSDFVEESSLVIEAMELSGPRTPASRDFILNFAKELTTLSQLVTKNRWGVTNVSISISSSPAIYGQAQCFEDLSPADCLLCFAESRTKLSHCIPSDSGRIYLDGCFLRYDNYSFFKETVDKQKDTVKCNSPNGVGAKKYMKLEFAKKIDQVIDNVTESAVRNGGFGVAEVKGGVIRVYALAQCWKTVGKEGCKSCLEKAGKEVRGCVPGSEGRGLNAGCYLRYSTEKFYNDMAETEDDAGLSEKGVVIAIVLSTVSFSLLSLFAACVGYARLSKTKHERNNLGWISSTISKSNLNYKYETLEKATDSFDPSRKLGQGGAGSVFKGILSDGEIVAVKRLFFNTKQWVDQFFNEVWKDYKSNQLPQSVDPCLRDEFPAKEASDVLQIGLLCTQASVTLRPSISEVVQMLTDRECGIPLPKQPPFLNASVLDPDFSRDSSSMYCTASIGPKTIEVSQTSSEYSSMLSSASNW
ncbi:hypothetical protein HHK36_007421 [Tetracentron sinense]|uniref:non-specific serine/threonine protein kinase n=1 Tax=Tetracentron sinense TaxID=13715 RepID=A0A835DQ36_TETSI|nr:hypothetical protein HHK36_007421 [Tetracentron sinense]